MQENCPSCGGPLAYRLIEGSISGQLGGGGWRWQHDAKPWCVQCSKLPCMLEGCDKRASIVVRHGMPVGGGKASTALQNDLWVCEDHRGAVESAAFREEMLGIGIAVLIVTLILVGALAASGVHIGVLFFIVVGVGFATKYGIRFLRESAQEFDRSSGANSDMPIKKKRKYVTRFKGDRGTVWSDDSWVGTIRTQDDS